MVSCEWCNIDICRSCSNDKTININGLINQPAVSGEWHGVADAKDKKHYVDLKLTFHANGEIQGVGVDRSYWKGVERQVEVVGFSYLQNIAIRVIPLEKYHPAWDYVIVGTTDQELDEIFGLRAGHVDNCVEGEADRIVLTKKK